jgi:hypothetical protein
MVDMPARGQVGGQDGRDMPADASARDAGAGEKPTVSASQPMPRRALPAIRGRHFNRIAR